MLKIFNNVFGLIFIVVLIEGCTGKVVSRNLSPGDLQTGKELEGIIHFLPALFKETSRTTILTENGVIVGTETGDKGIKCEPMILVKLVVYPDYNSPRLISYKHGVLEGYQFNVDLTDKGILTSVTTEARPDRGETVKNITEAAANAAKIAAPVPLAPDEKKACNDGPVVIGITRYDGYK